MPLSEEKVAALNTRAQHLIAIKESPSWPILKGIIQHQIETKGTVLCAVDAMEDSKLHHLRGHIHGLRYVLAVVEGGEKEFARSVKQARTLEALEGVEE